MRCHSEERQNDGKLHHPADIEAWKQLYYTFPIFGQEPQNIQLGLASNNFNPFGTNSTGCSTWPVLVRPNNLPPWICSKRSFIKLSMLIPEKYSPRNNINVYMEPLR